VTTHTNYKHICTSPPHVLLKLQDCNQATCCNTKDSTQGNDDTHCANFQRLQGHSAGTVRLPWVRRGVRGIVYDGSRWYRRPRRCWLICGREDIRNDGPGAILIRRCVYICRWPNLPSRRCRVPNWPSTAWVRRCSGGSGWSGEGSKNCACHG